MRRDSPISRKNMLVSSEDRGSTKSNSNIVVITESAGIIMTSSSIDSRDNNYHCHYVTGASPSYEKAAKPASFFVIRPATAHHDPACLLLLVSKLVIIAMHEIRKC
jgi:hypothetical protein